MEKFSGLEFAKLSKESIRRTLDNIQDRASSILLFTLQWKELESFLDKRFAELKSREEQLVLLENSTQQRAGELEEKEKQVEERFKKIVAREDEFDSKQRIETEKRSREIESFQRSSRDLMLFGKSIDKKLEYIEVKHNELVSMRNLTEKQFRELKLMQNFIKQKFEDIKQKEEEFGLKEKHFQQCSKDHEDCLDEIKLREKQLEELSQELRRQFELKDKNLKGKEKKVEECYNDIAAREKEFDIKRGVETERRESEMESIRLCSRELVFLGESIEKKLKQLEVKQNELECMGRSTGKQFREVTLMAAFVKDKLKEIRQKEEEFGSKEKRLKQCSKDLKLKRKCHEDCLAEIKLREKQLEELSQKLCHQLELKDKNFQELELRGRKLAELLKQLQLKESSRLSRALCSQVKTEPADTLSAKTVVGHSTDASIRFCVTMGGRDLQIFLNEHCNEHSSMVGEIAVALQLSSDPAELVLDAMEGFYPPFLMKGDQVFPGDVARRSCIMLLDQLMLVSPEIKPYVKEQAMKLASAWIAEVRADATDPLKVLGFLQLLASYGLASSFDADELFNLLLNVAKHHRAPRILHALGFVNKISAFIQNLVEGKQYLKAINFICAFELVDEFAPIPLLEQYLIHSRIEAKKVYRNGNRTPAAKIEADTKRISDLKAILKCIEDNKLESKYSSVKFRNHKDLIMTLEKQVRNEKAKVNNLKQNVNSNLSHQKRNANGKLCGQNQNVNGKLCGQKQNGNLKQTLKDPAPACFCSQTINSEKRVANKRPLAAISDETAGNTAAGANPISSFKKVPSTSPDPGDSNEGFIQQLIEKDRRLEAVKYIFQYNMADKFPPVTVLKDHLKTKKNAYEELWKKEDIPIGQQIIGVKKLIAALRAVIRCIEAHKLESDFPIDALQKEIVELEKKEEITKSHCRESEHQGKKSYTNPATTTTAAPMASGAAAPARPIPSAAAPATATPTVLTAPATYKSAATSSSTAAPTETTSATYKTGPQQHQNGNKRPRTASPERRYNLSGHPPRNMHPSHQFDGATPHYSWNAHSRPANLDPRVHYGDPRNSYAQPKYYNWSAPPNGYRY